ncbi:MAG: NACHT domain-containing protein, partial [Gammaproteobacteria bacterium]
VWILGRAGVGKTTLTQRIAYEWANPEDSDWTNQPQLFKSGVMLPTASEPIVIWVKLRELADYLNCLQAAGNLPLKLDKKTVLVLKTLSLFVAEKLLLADEIDFDELNDKAIQQILQRNKDNSLYLLDGYDEIASLADNHAARQVCDYLLGMPWVVVTSRPYADVPDNQKAQFRRLEIVGFSKEDALRYIAQHFDKQSSTPQQTELTQLVNTNANIQGIAVIPVNMEILCAIAGQAKTDIRRFASLSLSDIYLEVLVFIFRRYHQNPANHSSLHEQWDKMNEEDILADMTSRGVLPILSRLAKDLFVNNQLLFDADTLDRAIDEFIESVATVSSTSISPTTPLKRVQVKELIIATGLINGIRQESAMLKEQGYFLHLTIQEFLTAWWCAIELVVQAGQSPKPTIDLDLTIDAAEMSVEQLIAKYKYHSFYALVWPFVAGILTHGYTNAKPVDKTKYRLALIRFIELVEGAPRAILGTKSHYVLLLSCMTQIGRRVADLPHQ